MTTQIMDDFQVETEKQALIKQALLETYYKDTDSSFLNSKYGKIDVEANVNNRYLSSLEFVVPWVSRQIDLHGKKIIEIGCGTGSSTAAFAHFAKKIYAYDIDEKSIDAAKKRMRILDLKNVSFCLLSPEELIMTLESNHEKKVDIILLFAVLEHMTIEERHSVLKRCWSMLKYNGLLIVTETPNLLQYFDSHSSVLPFFHMLHSDLCARYAVKSPRAGFNDDFLMFKDMSPEEIDLKMTRWGRGVSYHDFELALGDTYYKHIVSSGFEEEILSWFPVTIEEEVLRYYVIQKGFNIPIAFTRVALNVILKKSNELIHSKDEETFDVNSRSYSCNMEIYDKLKLLEQILSSKRWKILNLLIHPDLLVGRIKHHWFKKQEQN